MKQYAHLFYLKDIHQFITFHLLLGWGYFQQIDLSIWVLCSESDALFSQHECPLELFSMLQFRKSQLQLKTLPFPCLLIFCLPYPVLFLPRPVCPPPSCSLIHCQEGPSAKGQFSTTRRRQRLAAAVATTVSGFQSRVDI